MSTNTFEHVVAGLSQGDECRIRLTTSDGAEVVARGSVADLMAVPSGYCLFLRVWNDVDLIDDDSLLLVDTRGEPEAYEFDTSGDGRDYTDGLGSVVQIARGSSGPRDINIIEELGGVR